MEIEEYNDKNYKLLKLISGFVVGEELFFSAWNERGFFSYNFKNGQVKFLAFLPEVFPQCNYGHFCKVGSEVYLMPCHGNSIICLDSENWGKYTEYKLNEKKIGEPNTWYGNAFHVGDCLYVRPYSSHSIACLNINKGKISYYDDFYEKVKSRKEAGDRPLFMGNALLDGKMYFVCQNTKILVEFDTSKAQSRVFDIDGITGNLENVCSDGENLWFYLNSGDLIKWNNNQGIKKVYKQPVKGNANENSICYFNNKIWVAGKSLYECVSVDVKNDEVHIRTFNREVEETPGSGTLCDVGNILLYLPNKNEHVYVIDEKSDLLKGFRIELRGEEYISFLNEMMHDKIKNRKVVEEINDDMLKLFVKELKHMEENT